MLGSVNRGLEKNFERINSDNEYLKYNEAIEEVKRMQNKEYVTDPEKSFANDLHAMICEELGIEDYTKLKYYTAIGFKQHTALDLYHGVDAFFELEQKNNKILRVTIDITANDKDGKADIVVRVPIEGLDRKEDTKKYLDKITETSVLVIDRFKELMYIK